METDQDTLEISVRCHRCKNMFPMNSCSGDKRRGYRCLECRYAATWPSQLRRKGLSVEDYERLLTRQSGQCAICHKETGHINKFGKPAKLAIDHDHKSGKIRGLLCNRCNRALGFIDDDPDRLLRAYHYLTRE